MGIENPEENQNAVKDLNGNVFIIQEGTSEGFMIFDPIAKEVIEETSTTTCPYIFNKDYDNYYFVPMNYYYRANDSFYHYVVSDYYTDLDRARELQSSFDTQLTDFRDITSDEKYEEYRNQNLNGHRPPLGRQHVGNKTYINNYKYIRDMNYPNNYDGSCGFVGASIVLNYWDKTMHSGTVAKQFMNEDGELISTEHKDPEHNIKDKLITYNNAADSTGKSNRL